LRYPHQVSSGNGAGAALGESGPCRGARRDVIDIACYAEARGGDKDMSLQRDAVFAVVAVVEDALRATDAEPEAPTLRGAVLWSGLTAGDLMQEQGPEGALAGLAFTVSCRARI
ncbi:hypothetical protein, partial [Micromonospora sp. NPDC049033]|uniref:hypothetical protein n=1 Tax=Micromonospora sp. NPDC049033 TaxID=3155149 RepID=UPI0033E4898F